MGIFIVLKNVS